MEFPDWVQVKVNILKLFSYKRVPYMRDYIFGFSLLLWSIVHCFINYFSEN